MSDKKSVVLMLALVGAGLFAGCHSSGPKEKPYMPQWVVNPKRSDSVYMYVIGSSVRQPTAVAAREAAFQDALYRLSLQMANEAGLGVSDVPPGGPIAPMEGAEILPDCVHIEENLTSYNGYVQVSFPVTEKRKIVEKLRKR